MSAALSSQTFIGSKISLISRAGIRYEGILYTIDAVNSTVALSKVKSFGTEERYSERPIPPRDEIYEYIIFRGNDIQDLHVCEPPNNEMQLISQDPAIVEITGKPPAQKNSYTRGRKVQFSGRSYQDSRESDYDDSDHRPSPHTRGSFSGDEYPPSSWYGHQIRGGYSSDTGRRTYYTNGYRGRSNGGYYNSGYYTDNARSVGPSPDMNGPMQQRRRGNNRQDQGPPPPTGPSRRDMGGQRFRPAGPVRTRRYVKDYDFESANAEIAKELERLSIDKTVAAPVSAGACETSSCPPSSTGGVGRGEHQTGATSSAGQSRGEGDAETGVSRDNSVEPAAAVCSSQGDDVGFYNRRRSFYDSISSEARDRAKGKSIRQLNWRDEQKLNLETFGFSQRGRRNNGGGGGYYGNNGGGGGYYGNNGGGGGYYGNNGSGYYGAGGYWSGSGRRMGPPPPHYYYQNNYYRYGGRSGYAGGSGGNNWR